MTQTTRVENEEYEMYNAQPAETLEYVSHSDAGRAYAQQHSRQNTSNSSYYEPATAKRNSTASEPAKKKEDTGYKAVMPEIKKTKFSLFTALRDYYSKERPNKEVDGLSMTVALFGWGAYWLVWLIGLFSFINFFIKTMSTFGILPKELKPTINPIDMVVNGHVFTLFGVLIYYGLTKFEFVFVGQLSQLWVLFNKDKGLFAFVVLVLATDVGGIWLGFMSTFSSHEIKYDDLFKFSITRDIGWWILFLVLAYYVAVSPERKIQFFKEYFLRALGAIR